METRLKLLRNNEIDLNRWDQVIALATNSRVYAESWYLDIVAPDWSGLIYGDYEYVMPVVQTKKWGISYIYQPTYAQQHGVFPPSTPKITREIITFLKSRVPYFNVSMNALNVVNDAQLLVENRKNFILSLKPSFPEILKAYNAHGKRYVKKANKLCELSTHVNLEEYLRMKEQYRHKGFHKLNLDSLKLIMANAMRFQKGIIYGAYSKRNELLAAAFFIYEQKRFTYINSVSTEEGKKDRAMYAIVNKFIEDHSNTNVLLDFEGSNIEGIARFFKGFGAAPETYQHIKYNNLPWYLKLLKK